MASETILKRLAKAARQARMDHELWTTEHDLDRAELYEAAAAEISRLTRELEEAREIIRDLVEDEDAGLVWFGRRLVCAYCTADGLYSVAHAADCPIIRARHALATIRSEAQGDAEALVARRSKLQQDGEQ